MQPVINSSIKNSGGIKLKLLFGIIGFLIFLIVSIGIYGNLKIQSAISEAKALSSSGRYQEAFTTLQTAQLSWFGDNNEELPVVIKQIQPLVESEKNFELGKTNYEAGDYQTATKYLTQVSPDDMNFEMATNYNKLAKGKLNEEEQSKNNKPTSTPAPTPPQAVLGISTAAPVQNPNLDSTCKNNASLARIQYQQYADEQLRKQMPWLFSFDEAKKKYPGEYTSKYYDESALFNMWVTNSRNELATIESGIKVEEDKFYYQQYNNCLQGQNH